MTGNEMDYGPIGKPRSIGMTIFLSIITFTIWTYIWSYWNGEELRKHNRAGAGGVVYLILVIIIYPVVMFMMADEVQRMYEERGETSPITTLWGLWFLLPLIGNIIWYVRIQNALNDFWMDRGAPAPTGAV
jgi:hypothetical protein